MKLYELTNAYQDLLDLAADAEDGEDQQAFADTLEGLGGEIDQKIESCAAVVRTLEAEAAGLKAEQDRVAARRKALAGNIDRLKAYMKRSMELCDKRKVRGKLFTVGIQKTPPKLRIDEGAEIPDRFRRVIIEPNKAALRDALKSGHEVEGVRLEQGETLRIR